MPFIVRKALDIAIPLIMIKNVKHTTKTDYGEASPFVIKNPEKPSATGWSLSSEKSIRYLLKEAKKNADSSRSASPRPVPPRPVPSRPASLQRFPSSDLPYDSDPFSEYSPLPDNLDLDSNMFLFGTLDPPIPERPIPIRYKGSSESDYGDLDVFLI